MCSRHVRTWICWKLFGLEVPVLWLVQRRLMWRRLFRCSLLAMAYPLVRYGWYREFKFQGQPSRQTGLNIAKPNYRGEDDIFSLKSYKISSQSLKMKQSQQWSRFNWWNMPGFFKTYWVYPVWSKSRATLEKVGLFWKKPYFFFKRLKLDNLKKVGLFPNKPYFFQKKPYFFD